MSGGKLESSQVQADIETKNGKRHLSAKYQMQSFNLKGNALTRHKCITGSSGSHITRCGPVSGPSGSTDLQAGCKIHPVEKN